MTKAPSITIRNTIVERRAANYFVQSNRARIARPYVGPTLWQRLVAWLNQAD